MSPKMRNEKFVQTNPFFRKCCELAKVEATPRQASKFRNGYGAAFSQKGSAIRMGLIEDRAIEEDLLVE